MRRLEFNRRIVNLLLQYFYTLNTFYLTKAPEKLKRQQIRRRREDTIFLTLQAAYRLSC